MRLMKKAIVAATLSLAVGVSATTVATTPAKAQFFGLGIDSRYGGWGGGYGWGGGGYGWGSGLGWGGGWGYPSYAGWGGGYGWGPGFGWGGFGATAPLAFAGFGSPYYGYGGYGGYGYGPAVRTRVVYVRRPAVRTRVVYRSGPVVRSRVTYRTRPARVTRVVRTRTTTGMGARGGVIRAGTRLDRGSPGRGGAAGPARGASGGR